jgi:hypothetical protein
MDTKDFFTCIYDKVRDRYTLDCGVVKGVVEHYECLDKPDKEYSVCYLEVMGTKIPESEIYARDVNDGMESIAISIVNFSEKLRKNLQSAMEKYLVKISTIDSL